MSELAFLSAGELLDGYRAGDFSPPEALDAFAERIDAYDGGLGAFTTLCLERARSEALEAAARYQRRTPAGPLDGLPLAVKDLIDTAGLPTSYGSALFAGHHPAEDAAVVAQARQAGAIVIGKTQTHEFAWGISSVNVRLGTAHNPWRPSRISGGSSGGSAVALAAGFAPLALGTDTGGSIRIPSAFCGSVGLKPTYGSLSTVGVFPLAPTLDHVGPMARTPADVLLLFAALGGDSKQPALAAALEHPLRGLRVGICPELSPVPLAADVAPAIGAATELLGELGAELRPVRLPEAAAAVECYLTIQRAEALDVHRRAGLFPERLDGYSDDVRRHLEAATAVDLPAYLEAWRLRRELSAGFKRLFAEVDLLASPVAACSPFVIGDDELRHHGRARTLRELVLPFTVPQDLAGLPACTIRAGFDASGCPVALQLTGPRGGEAGVLRAVTALWDASPELQRRRPELEASAAAGQDAASGSSFPPLNAAQRP